MFGDDDDQKLAFKLIVSAFIVELFKKPEQLLLGKRRIYMQEYKKYLDVDHKGQFICFMSGPGGSGELKNGMIKMMVGTSILTAIYYFSVAQTAALNKLGVPSAFTLVPGYWSTFYYSLQ